MSVKELIEAIRKKNDSRIVELLKTGEYVNEPDEWGALPLTVAASQGSLKAVKLLIEKGAKIDQIGPVIENRPSSWRKTPIAEAVLRFTKDGDAIAKYLVEKGADLNAVVQDSEQEYAKTLFFIVVSFCRTPKVTIERVQWFLAKGADVNWQVHKYAGNAKIAEQRAKEGVARYDASPLYHAVLHERPDLVELLLANGAKTDVGAAGHVTYNPLGYALQRGLGSIIKMLVSHGASSAPEYVLPERAALIEKYL